FARTVAHDLKTPIGVVVSFADYYIQFNDQLNEKSAIDTVKKIRQHGRTTANIIEELLLLSGVRKQEVIPKPLHMENIILNAQQRLAYVIEDYRAEIIEPESWPIAYGYGPWIEEVWTNYISNALKYGGEPPLIELGATVQENGLVRFWVKDNGPGLNEVEQATLFTEFTRLNDVKAKGHGLGLSIVRRIVEKLGGQVGVESEGVSGKGSLFYFSLPVLDG
ncbi:MAG: HAMP domain-containing sensor histidine kinase, partial [Chloroflexota bacterium]